MDEDESFRCGMRRAFEQVCLAPIHGSVMTDEPPVFLKFTGIERSGGLSARASGLFAKMLSKQLDDRLSLSDVIDDSNLIRLDIQRTEDEEIDSDSDAEGEGSDEQ